MFPKSVHWDFIKTNVILYHGTSYYNLESFLTTAPRVGIRSYTRKPSFCTSRSFREASLFAFRKLSIGDFESRNFDRAGVVLEFDGSRLSNEDYEDTRDPHASLRSEQEVAVFAPKKLELIAFWKFDSVRWIRNLQQKEIV